jgi:hypothetical protein
LGEIYTPHAFFGCTTSGWHISSAKGMRKNTKSVKVNRQLIDASRGNVSIKRGDRITIGTFEFKLFLPPRDHLGNTADMAKDFEIIAHIEQRLHVLVGRELSSKFETWWTDNIPKDVREECEARARAEREEEHPFRFADLSHLNKVLIANWDTLRLGGLGKIWRKRVLNLTFT